MHLIRSLYSTAGIAAILACIPQVGKAMTSVTASHIVTHHDQIPRFCASPTHVSVTDGPWSNPSTWNPSQVPGAEARVRISDGTTVTYNVNAGAPGLNCVEVVDSGSLEWSTAISTLMNVRHIQVLPNGNLSIGRENSPIAAGETATVVFRDVALDVDIDPAQYGNGLHVFGNATVHGRTVAPTFSRLTTDIDANATAITVRSGLQGWQPSDQLLIPDTRQIPWRKNHRYDSQAEEIRVSNVTGSTIQLATATAFGHRGPTNADGNVGSIEQAMKPHVGNLSRNVIFRSVRLNDAGKDRYCVGADNLSATGDCVTRGHVMAHGRAEVDVRYAAFENLGRTSTAPLDNTEVNENGQVLSVGTNQIGRYSFHAHHVIGPVNPSNTGYQYRFVGNVVQGFLKWGLAVHDTHYGLVADNILYDGVGSAVATEDGNESFNVFERNFIVHTRAGDTEQILESVGRAGVVDGRSVFGFTRDGFWFSGMNNYVRDNVVTNAPDFAYNYNGYYLDLDQPVPNFRGANMLTDATEQRALRVLESSRNEAYGATGQGLWLTWSRGCCNVTSYQGVSLFEDYRIWHVNNAAVQTYHESRNSYVDFVLRADPEVSANSQGGSLRFNRGFHFANSSYENGQTTLINADVQGFNVGVLLPLRPEDGTDDANVTRVESGLLHNFVNVQEFLPNIGEKRTVLRDVQFEHLNHAAIPGVADAPTHIQMRYSVNNSTNFVDRTTRMTLIDFDGVAGADYELFFLEQAPDYPIPPPPNITHVRFDGCPEPNLTNQQCWDRHQVTVGGALAPCVAVDGETHCATAEGRANALSIDGLAFEIAVLFENGFE